MNVIAPFLSRGRTPMPARPMRALDAAWPRFPAAPAASLPARSEGCDWAMLAPALAQLGPVLHVDARPAGEAVQLPDGAPWPARPELVGLACAAQVVSCARLDSEGPQESLHFLDAQGTSIASLWLLPDSDFLVWETLFEQLPAMQLADLAWQCGQCHVPRGRARVCRLERARVVGGELLDAVIPERISAIGQMRAQQLAKAAGASLLKADIGDW